MRYFVTIGSRTLEVELGVDGVRVEGESVLTDFAELDGTEVRTLLLGGRSHTLLASRTGRGEWSLHLGGRPILAQVMDERTRAIRERMGQSGIESGPRDLTAPMPGLVVRVEVSEGDVVSPGQGMVIVEAMKMENELKSVVHARVKAVRVREGEAVEKDQLLVELEAVPAPDQEA